MKKRSLLKCVTSAACAAAMVLTLTPFAGVAFADETGDEALQVNVTDPKHAESCELGGEETTLTCENGHSSYECLWEEARWANVDEEGNAIYVCPQDGCEAGLPTNESQTPAPTAIDSNISMTLPLFVIFGGDTGYDVANPQPKIEANFQLINSGKSNAKITNITSTNINADKLIVSTDKAPKAANDPIFSLYQTYRPEKRINFGYAQENVTPAANVLIGAPAKSSRECAFSLNLTNTNEVANADAQINVANLANEVTEGSGKFKYGDVNQLSALTITIAKETAHLMDAGNLTEASADTLARQSFYLKDNASGEIYDVKQVKAFANDIYDNKDSSSYKVTFKNYATHPDTYECKAKFDGNQYPVRVIEAGYKSRYESSDPKRYVIYSSGISFQFQQSLVNIRVSDSTGPNMVLREQDYWHVPSSNVTKWLTDAIYSLDPELYNNLRRKKQTISGFVWDDHNTDDTHYPNNTYWNNIACMDSPTSYLYIPSLFEVGYISSDGYDAIDIPQYSGLSTNELRVRNGYYGIEGFASWWVQGFDLDNWTEDKLAVGRYVNFDGSIIQEKDDGTTLPYASHFTNALDVCPAFDF